MNKIAFFLSIFILTTVIGLYVGHNLIPQVGETSPITGKPVEDVSNSLFFFAYIITVTAVLLVVMKFYKGRLLFKVLEVLIIFVGSQIVYSFLLYDLLAALGLLETVTQMQYEISIILLAVLTVVVRFIRRRFLVLNVTLSVAIAGAGGLLGATLGFAPSLLLVIGLSVYDVVSVFGTKHMLKLADQSRLRDLPVMFETPSKGIKTGPRKGVRPSEDILGLGTGDIAIPLVFFVSVLRDFGWMNVLGAMIGAMFGLGLTIYYVTHVKRIALPALPPIIGFSLLGFAVSWVLGM
ncbi:MAG: hypothetical protein JXB14_03560 [Candidatus Altiarchaeota archaeon]|nr:hypothetical protein [Candidatus Altiarchaeota archaeon]